MAIWGAEKRDKKREGVGRIETRTIVRARVILIITVKERFGHSRGMGSGVPLANFVRTKNSAEKTGESSVHTEGTAVHLPLQLYGCTYTDK